MRIGTRLLLLLLVGALALPVFAQRPGGRPGGPPGQMRGGAITGTVIDADTGQPVELATATVWSARDSSLVTGALTDAEGGFDIRPLRPGRYYLTLTYVGYVNQRIDDLALRPGSLVADLGTLELVPDAALLEGVQVEGIRDDIEVQVDRTVFNTADQIAADVGSVTDLLRNVPAIEVDIDGNISLRGNQNVAIQINGRPVPITGAFLASYLQQLPASSVERVEVIPNPSAKYDPEGLGGIVNIILKENTDLGLSGGITTAVETIGGFNASGNVGYQRGPWTTFVTYGLRRNIRESNGLNDADFTLLPGTDGQPPLDTRFTDDDGERSSLGHLFSASADYKLTPKATLSASGRLSLGFGSDAEVNFRDEVFDDGRRLESYRLTDEDGDELNTDLAFTFTRVQERSTDELTVEARYTADARDDVNLFTEGIAPLVDEAIPDPTDIERNTTDRFKQEGSLQLDWVKPIGGLSLETGFRSEFTRTDDDFLVEDQDLVTGIFARSDTLSNSFVFDEQVHAVYGLLSRSFGPLSIKAGARLEQAFTTFDLARPAPGQEDVGTFDNDYFSVFPSAFATYKLSEGVSAKASYSRRINRPSRS
ncbi:MAG: TonB-dependent receptor, partial [Bacteroidota bacterium]